MAVRAPAFETGLTWFNSEPLVLSDLQGRYLLLEFFTLGCINCMNNIETIKKLHQRYSDALTVIGVHVGKFSYEKESDALAQALKRFGISYAIVQDFRQTIAKAYAIKGWPTTILIDNRGYLVHQSSGEQNFLEWSGRLSACGLASGHQKRSKKSANKRLHFPQKLLATTDFLAISNTNENEVWLSDYEGHVFEVIEAEKPMGLAYREHRLYICEANALTQYDLKTKEKRSVITDLRNPYDLLLNKETLWIALAGSHLINSYNLADFSLRDSYGNRFEALRDGDADSCQLAQPSGMCMIEEVLYFVDAESSSLRKIENGVVSTLIGEGLFTYGDSNVGELLLQHPQAVCAGIMGDGCGGGRLFIADTFNRKIKAYFPDDGSMRTLLEGVAAPSGISKKGCHLYIASTNTHEVIVFDLSKMKSHVMHFSFNESATPHPSF